MSSRPRKGRRVAFSRDAGITLPSNADPVTGLRFTIAVQNGGETLIDFTALRPRPGRFATLRLRAGRSAPARRYGLMP